MHHDLDQALNRHGVDVDDVTTVITSHLHFDRSGQNHRFASSRVIVQKAEVEAATAPHYTVPGWAFPSNLELTIIDGDHQVAPGVGIIATPGHTPGHQSVLIDGSSGIRTVVCCQASWNVDSWEAAMLGDEGWNKPLALRRYRSCMGSTQIEFF